jgi:hypothetical protein
MRARRRIRSPETQELALGCRTKRILTRRVVTGKAEIVGS